MIAVESQNAVAQIQKILLDSRPTAERRAAERRAAYIEGCQRVGPKVYREPNLVRGPRSGAVFLGSALPTVPRDVAGRVMMTLDGREFTWVSREGFGSFSVVVPPGTLVERSPS